MSEETTGDTSGQTESQTDESSQQNSTDGADASKNMVPKTELEKVIAQRQGLKAQLSEQAQQLAMLQEKVKSLPPAEQLEAFNAWQAEQAAAEQDKAIKAGDVESLTKAAQAPLLAQIEALTTRSTVLASQITSIQRDNALIQAASSANAVDPTIVASLLRDRVQMKETDTGFVPTFLDAEGNPAFQADGTPVSDAGAFVQMYLADKPYLVKTNANPGSGAKPNGGSTNANSKPISLEQFNAITDPAERAKAAREMLKDGTAYALMGVDQPRDPGDL